jgi:hypothetical protein
VGHKKEKSIGIKLVEKYSPMAGRKAVFPSSSQTLSPHSTAYQLLSGTGTEPLSSGKVLTRSSIPGKGGEKYRTDLVNPAHTGAKTG